MAAIQIPTPRGFSFDRTVRGHGWFDLAPFSYDRAGQLLTFGYARGRGVVSVIVRAGTRGLAATVATTDAASRREAVDAASRREAVATVRSVLRLDEDLTPVRATLAGAPALLACIDAGGGRLMRAPTVFEDVVKMLCTTNCSWGLTRVMVERLVTRAGAVGPGGVRAFPTAAALARRPASFFRDVVRAGYRAPFFKELATRVASSTLELESLRDPRTPTDVARERLRSIKGIGPYATDNLLRLLGHYDDLGLDSWCRARYRKLYPRAARAADLDAAIARRYRAYAPYQGLAMWLDLTKTWHEDVGDDDAKTNFAP